MSFSKESKLELIKNVKENADTAFAYLSGLFHACGQLEKNDKGFDVSVLTDINELYDCLNELCHMLYGDFLELEVEDDYVINKTTYYRIYFPHESVRQILQDTGIISLQDGEFSINFGIDHNIVNSEETKRAFVRGAYIGCSTSSIRLSELENMKTTSGYHMEFSSKNYDFLTDLASLLAEFGIIAKLVQRKSSYVLYFKEAELIKDLLALMGANQSVLALAAEMITREKRNQVNRQVNCINANISKTVEASLKQVAAINTIISTIGLESLSEELQEVAMLRLANPEESLDELLSLSTIKLSKSGLNHRLNKLIRIAKELS